VGLFPNTDGHPMQPNIEKMRTCLALTYSLNVQLNGVFFFLLLFEFQVPFLTIRYVDTDSLPYSCKLANHIYQFP